MSILAPVFALLLSASAQGVDVTQDPRCPHSDMNFPRGPGTVCIGGMRRHYGFAFIYPRAAERIPAMMAYFRQQAAAHERWIRARANENCERPEVNGGDCPTTRAVYEQGWTLDADLPTLAAASSVTSYTNLGLRDGWAVDAILIDRRLGRRISLGDLFINPHGGLAMVQRDFCRNLRGQVRARRRSESRVAGGGIPIADTECPSVGRHPVTLCAEHGRVTTIYAGVIPPTVSAFPEGEYEVEVAMTPAMIAALKPAYRSSFGRPSRAPTPDRGVCAR